MKRLDKSFMTFADNCERRLFNYCAPSKLDTPLVESAEDRLIEQLWEQAYWMRIQLLEEVRSESNT